MTVHQLNLHTHGTVVVLSWFLNGAFGKYACIIDYDQYHKPKQEGTC